MLVGLQTFALHADFEGLSLRHLFGHEGENSLMSYLKKEGLASSLGSTAGHDLWSSSNMSIEVTLTDKGLENYEKVITSVFEFANYLKEAGPQQYVFDEIKQMGKLNFDFQDESSGLMYC